MLYHLDLLLYFNTDTKTENRQISKELITELSKKIEIIGEPLIKRKLTSMLESVIENADRETQINYYQQKLNQLRTGEADQ
jgi:hypothetical protein